MYEASLPRFVRFFTEQTIPLICVEPMYVVTYLDRLRWVPREKRLRNGEIVVTRTPSASTVH